ncbi:hypothetical protein FOCG_18217 [Fusarium oxysporum f. sp. radicis-lycopersici 26381]|nr:hypothetical protein FOCG_18217 [Fusarium oxysporum f. sp. radicis-lycopersici 26381]
MPLPKLARIFPNGHCRHLTGLPVRRQTKVLLLIVCLHVQTAIMMSASNVESVASPLLLLTHMPATGKPYEGS